MELEEYQRKTYYQLLGVDHAATQDQIKIAYRDLARVYHPDSNFFADIINEAPKPKDIELFKLITSAYNTLSDEAARAKYDEELALKPKQHNSNRPMDFGRAMKQEYSRPMTARPFGQGNESPRQSQGRPSPKNGFVEDSDFQNIRPMSDLFRKRRTLVDHLLLFVGFGLPALTLLGVGIWLIF